MLARARAIDTSSVVAAVGQAWPGEEIAAQGPTGVGGSVVASALGEVLVGAGVDPELLVCDIDLAAARKARETVAVMHNRSGFAHGRKAESLG